MEGMSTLGNDVGLLPGKPEAEAEGFEAGRALLAIVERVVAGCDGEGCGRHCCVGMNAEIVPDGGVVG
jgi:hypothetical protein